MYKTPFVKLKWNKTLKLLNLILFYYLVLNLIQYKLKCKTQLWQKEPGFSRMNTCPNRQKGNPVSSFSQNKYVESK